MSTQKSCKMYKYRRFFVKKRIFSLLSGVILFNLIISTPAYSSADYLSDMEERKSWPVQSNEIENWPEGPSIGSASAILMEADTGIILYEKNIHEKMFPASTTKLMTCLLAMDKENASLSDMVSFSDEAVYSVSWDASKMGMDSGEAMTLEDCLYGILVLSANEVCNAVAEYVSGDIPSFVDAMNKKAEELGCEDTHFNNAHGYTDENHYTSAYDLALIGREFFKNELLAKIARTKIYHWYPTDTQPDDIYLPSKNFFLKGFYECEGLVGSKTGYTDESREVLVTCAERNGMRLVCVVMETEEPYQYEDTLSLFNYGFNNFDLVNVSAHETKYNIEDDYFFKTEKDVFGNSSSFLSLDTSSVIILPKTCNFEDLTSDLVYTDNNEDILGKINYSYNDKYLGNVSLVVANQEKTSFVFSDQNEFMDVNEEKPTFIYVNTIIKWIGFVLGALIIILLLKRIISNFHFARNRKYVFRDNKKRKKRH